MTIKDYDTFYKFWMETPGIGLNSIDDSREGIAKYLCRNPDSCFVAKEDDKITGTIMSGHDGKRGFIYHLAVKPSSRKQGIASELVDKALAFLKKEGLFKVAILVMGNNEIGNDFWEKRGFVWRDDLKYRDFILNPLE